MIACHCGVNSTWSCRYTAATRATPWLSASVALCRNSGTIEVVGDDSGTRMLVVVLPGAPK